MLHPKHSCLQTLCALFLGAAANCVAGLAAVAQEQTGGATPPTPIIVYTQNATARLADGPADQLLQRARQQGQVRVIIGLRTTMQMEHTLAPIQVRAQQEALRRMQDAILARSLATVTEDLVTRFTFIPYMSVFVTADQLARLLNDPEVVSIQEDIPKPPALAQSKNIVNAPQVWAKAVDGTGYAVAVLDTGVAKAHPMLAGKVVSEACYSSKNAAQKIGSFCPGGVTSSTAAGSGLNCPIAGCDHGTHVASIAAGDAGNLAGIARGAKVIAIQIFSQLNRPADCGAKPAPCISAFDTDIIKGLQRVYALRNDFKIAAANMSIGGDLFTAACDAESPAMATALLNLRKAAIAPIVASGNEGSSTQIGFPACISHSIAVGNTMKEDWIALSSNHNPLVKLMAPGSDIRAAVPNNKYGVKTGTSMAAPHVAGAFAVLTDAKPAASFVEILEALICSGKIVDRRYTVGIPELDPAKPRIDLLGAYNFLKKPPNVARTWGFTTSADALDWTAVRGFWKVAGGFFQVSPTVNFWNVAAVADCNSRLEVIARIKRVDNNPPEAWNNTGLFVKATFNYTLETVSGYFFAFNKAINPATDKAGQGVVYRAQNYNLDLGTGNNTQLCLKFMPIHVGGFNILRVVSNGSSHSFFLNDKLVCTVSDATYATGQVGIGAFIDSGGHSVAVDYVRVKAIGSGASPDFDEVMDPEAFLAQADDKANLGGSVARRDQPSKAARTN